MTSSPELHTNEGFHMEAFVCYPPSEIFEVPEGVLFFYWAFVVQGSFVGGYCIGRMISPFSATSDSLPPFLFLSAASLEDAYVGAGVGG